MSVNDIEKIAHLGMWEWVVGRHAVTWSPELYRIYGVDPAEFVPSLENCLSKIHPEDRDRARAAINQAFTEQRSFSIQERILRPDGTVRYLHSWGHPVLDASGRVARLLGICLDVTERALAELAAHENAHVLQRSNSLLRGTLESTADGILSIDNNQRITGYNKNLCDLWNVSEELLKTLSFWEIVYWVDEQLIDPASCLARLKDLLSNPAQEGKDILRFKDGRVFERYSRPMRVSAGWDSEIVGRVFSYRNVTALYKSESAMQALVDISRSLAEARLDLKQVIRTIAVKVAEFFEEGCVVRLFSEDQSQMTTGSMHHVRADVLQAATSVFENERAAIDRVGVEELLRTGSSVLVAGDPEALRTRVAESYLDVFDRFPFNSWILAPLRVAGRILGVVGVSRLSPRPPFTRNDQLWLQEVADRAALSIDNAQLYQSAQNAIQLREDFMSIASHELRTPLTPLRLELQYLSHVLQNGTVSAGPNQKRLEAMVARSDIHVGKLIRLVEDILDATRLKTGHLSLKPEEFDLTELVSEVVDRIGKGRSAVEFIAGEVNKGCWDKLRIEQVVTNLLTNAIKFGEGKPITVSTSRQREMAVITVQDRGLGISAEDQAQIFERFERAGSAKNYGGLGIGLYIAHQIVELHGGKISIDSSPGTGSRFRVELPLPPGA